MLFHPLVLPAVAFAAVWLYLLNHIGSPLRELWALINGGSANILGGTVAALVAVALIGILKQFGL